MGKQDFSIPALMNRLTSEAEAYKMLEELLWSDGTPDACPLCNASGRFYFLAPRDGTETRKTRTGAPTQRRLWKCATCRRKFSVLHGTVLHGTKVSIRSWLFAFFEACASKNGVSARELARKYDLTPKTAWFLMHRIREAMKRDPLAPLMSGVLAADETWIGGNPVNRHASARLAEGHKRWATSKTTVLSVIDKASGETRSAVIPNVSAATLRKAMEQELAINLGESTLHTDSWKGYVGMEGALKGHHSVNHLAGEYARGNVSSNRAEGYFSQLKRSIDGTHHHVSKQHLPRYLAQFDFLYSTCKLDDSDRMRRLVGQVGGRRLTYRPLVGTPRS